MSARAALHAALLVGLLFAVNGDDCPCLSADVVDANKYESYLSAYGVGCSAHDAAASIVEECSGSSKPAYCHREWCYVNVSCFDVFHPSHHMIGTGIARSYQACGELPIQYFGKTKAGAHPSSEHKELKGTTLRAFMLNNSGGWKGSFLDASGKNVKMYGSKSHGDSPFVAFAKNLAHIGEAQRHELTLLPRRGELSIGRARGRGIPVSVRGSTRASATKRSRPAHGAGREQRQPRRRMRAWNLTQPLGHLHRADECF